jgi:hypothetical protein
LPGGSIFITGGDDTREVVRLDARTFAVLAQPLMHTARYHHAAVYHSKYVYLLGRTEYVCAEGQ